MKKTYIKPTSNQFCFIEPLTPLCESQDFEYGGNTDETNVSWSNKKENPVWGGTHKGPWGE